MDVWNIFNSQEKTSIDDTIVAGYGNTVSKTIYCKKPVFWIRIQIGSVPVGTYQYLLRTFVDLNQYCEYVFDGFVSAQVNNTKNRGKKKYCKIEEKNSPLKGSTVCLKKNVRTFFAQKLFFLYFF